jgi:hypothetical protein
MKTARSLLILLLGCFVILTSAFDFEPYEESAYTAVLMTRADLEKSIAFQNSRQILEIGKIYKKDSWIFITEKYKGIHLIDNTNPASPVKAGFIRVPGCIDIAMKNNSILADNSVDLVTIEISQLPAVKVVSRVKNVFPELLPPDLPYIPNKYNTNSRPENTVIVEWKKRK